MPVTVTRNFALQINGQTIVLSEEDMKKIKTEEEVTVTCDGPRCQSRNQRATPFSVSWRPEEVSKDPTKLPDEFFTMVKAGINPAQPQEKVFCGPQCARDFLQYSYVPPQPPRIALENAKREQAAKLEELNPHLVSGKTEHHVTEIPATLLPHSGDTLKVVQKTYNPSPVNQADGYVDQEADVHA